MFEFLDKFDNEYGSEDRYHDRAKVHTDAYGDRKRYLFWWLVHNCVAHPLIGFFPTRTMFDLHDWTSARINAKEKKDPVVEALPLAAKALIRVVRDLHELLGSDSRFDDNTLWAAIRKRKLEFWKTEQELDAEIDVLYKRGVLNVKRGRVELTPTGWSFAEALGPATA